MYLSEVNVPEKYEEEELAKYDEMVEEMSATEMSLTELIQLQRRWNLKNDPAKVKTKKKRRKANAVAKKSRKVNRQKHK